MGQEGCEVVSDDSTGMEEMGVDTLVDGVVYTDDETSQCDQSQKMILDKGDVRQLLLRSVFSAMETRQWYLVLQGVYASLRQVEIEMIEILVQDTGPIGADGQVAGLRRGIQVAALD
jgi:hypothetical protein